MDMFRKPLRLSLAALAMALLGIAALAQGSAGSEKTPATATPGAGAAVRGPTPPASAPGRQMGPRHGRRHAAWWGSKVTPGWAMMSWQERNEHREKMRSFQTYEDCRAYLDQHHEKMMARAKEKGKEPLAQARRDACARLKP